MSSYPYKGSAVGWHYCPSHGQPIWATANSVCSSCGQVVILAEGGQQVLHQQWPQNTHGAYPTYTASSTHYAQPTVPSNAPVPPDYSYGTQAVTASPQSYYPTAQATPTTSSKATSAKQASGSRWVCDLCPAGQSVFGREPDLVRHKNTVHRKEQLIDEGGGFECDYPGCDRRGRKAFTRHDHYIEHLRGFHKQDIPKRNTKKRD